MFNFNIDRYRYLYYKYKNKFKYNYKYGLYKYKLELFVGRLFDRLFGWFDMERFLELLGKVITYAATAVLLILALVCEVLHFAGLKVIALIRLTVDTIREELSRRKELTSKGVTNVIITDFIEKNGCTEITLAALNARGEYVSDVKMKAFSSSGIQEGTKISLTV